MLGLHLKSELLENWKKIQPATFQIRVKGKVKHVHFRLEGNLRLILLINNSKVAESKISKSDILLQSFKRNDIFAKLQLPSWPNRKRGCCSQAADETSGMRKTSKMPY